MGVFQVQLPEQIRELIDRQIAEGRVGSPAEFLIEAARRYAEELQLEDQIAAEAALGIADAEAGRYVTIATQSDADRLHERTLTRLRQNLSADC